MECTVDIVNANVSLKIILKKIYLAFKKCHVNNLIFLKATSDKNNKKILTFFFFFLRKEIVKLLLLLLLLFWEEHEEL